MEVTEFIGTLFIIGMIIVGTLFIGGLIIQLFPITIYQTMEDGQHTGYVTAVDTSGIIWKTTEVYFKTDAQSSQEDSYCVIDENVKKQLLEAQKSKRLITLHYDDYFIIGMPLCGVNQIIRSIE